jgi:hypothetical protein
LSNRLHPGVSEAVTLEQAVKETKATTTESWHGPYDPRPRPEVGRAAVLMSLTRRASEFKQASSNLVQVLPKSGLPDEYQRLLKNYCAQKITETETKIAEFSLPEEVFRERQRREMEKLGEELRQKRPPKPPNLL